MIRIFCDCCGEEMKYEDMGAVGNNATASVSLKGKANSIQAKVRFVFMDLKIGDSEPHIDLCANCRWEMIDKLDPRARLQEPSLRKLTANDVRKAFTRFDAQKSPEYYAIPSSSLYALFLELYQEMGGQI